MFYLHFTEKELLAFGGVWGPDRDELMAYRTLLRDNHEEFEAILAEKDPAKQALLRTQSALSDFYLGSVHAIAETGEFIIASNSGSQNTGCTSGQKPVGIDPGWIE